jgi:hypothetical protein
VGELIDHAHARGIRVLLGFTPFGYDGVNQTPATISPTFAVISLEASTRIVNPPLSGTMLRRFLGDEERAKLLGHPPRTEGLGIERHPDAPDAGEYLAILRSADLDEPLESRPFGVAYPGTGHVFFILEGWSQVVDLMPPDYPDQVVDMLLGNHGEPVSCRGILGIPEIDDIVDMTQSVNVIPRNSKGVLEHHRLSHSQLLPLTAVVSLSVPTLGTRCSSSFFSGPENPNMDGTSADLLNSHYLTGNSLPGMRH